MAVVCRHQQFDRRADDPRRRRRCRLGSLAFDRSCCWLFSRCGNFFRFVFVCRAFAAIRSLLRSLFTEVSLISHPHHTHKSRYVPDKRLRTEASALHAHRSYNKKMRSYAPTAARAIYASDGDAPLADVAARLHGALGQIALVADVANVSCAA